jgi:glutamate dehydrogenase (NAD(P)+)
VPPTDIINRPAFLEITWNDPESEARGYVVIDGLVRGVSSGGLRMRSGCTLDEVRGLARAMTKKEAVHLKNGQRYIPVGGGKGGIDFDPHHPDAANVLERFLVDLQPIISTVWATGEDLGVRQSVIDEIFERRQLGSCIDAVKPLVSDSLESETRLARGFTTSAFGVAQDELVGGLGVAQSALTAIAHRGQHPSDIRAVVQGFGSMGGATCLFLSQAGVRVIGIVDAEGMVIDNNGLDVKHLMANRDHFGRMDRARLPEGAKPIDGTSWLSVDCELLVPAALSSCITVENQAQITAKLIVEASNLPITPEAETLLVARGITVIPDFVANSGTNAWWWWLLFGDVDGSWEQSESMVRARLDELTTQIIEISKARAITPREAAIELVRENLAELLLIKGAR